MNYIKRLLSFTLIAAFICQLFFINYTFADDISESEPFAETFSDDGVHVSGLPVIDATAAIVMDFKSGRVLYSKNAVSKKSIASTTKIMTAIVAIENGKLDDVVTVSKRAASIGGSTINLKTGQQYTLKELLYGIMLSSGNDAAIAIAEHIGGTVENFAIMMNKKAKGIGAKDTSFVTPHGLDADEHYSTAYDLAIITRYALKIPLFSQIVATIRTSIPGIQLYNTNELLGYYPGTDGVKTGYTGKAGRCLVASVTRDGMRLISVVLGSPTRNKRAISSKAILDYAFKNYKPHNILEANTELKLVPVYKGVKNSVSIKATEDVVIPLTDDEFSKLEKRVVIPDRLIAPVYAGTDTGYVEFVVDDKVIAQTTLKIWHDVKRKTFINYLGGVFTNWGKMVHEGVFMD